MNYDTYESIQEAVKTLTGLNDLIQARKEAYYQHGKKLNQWVVLGCLALDTCGNTGRLGKMVAPRWRLRMLKEPLPPVLSYDEFELKYPECLLGITMDHRPVPRVSETCTLCGKDWTIRNVHDWVYRDAPYHTECYRLTVIEEARNFFSGIFSEVGGAYLQPIPNQYSPREDAPPWFFAYTKKGVIKIGERKRVINIDWSQSYIEHDASIFEDNVTKEGSLIHAWGRDKCVEYLKKLLK